MALHQICERLGCRAFCLYYSAHLGSDDKTIQNLPHPELKFLNVHIELLGTR